MDRGGGFGAFLGYLIQLVESVVLLFVLAVCIDLVRARLFDALGGSLRGPARARAWTG